MQIKQEISGKLILAFKSRVTSMHLKRKLLPSNNYQSNEKFVMSLPEDVHKIDAVNVIDELLLHDFFYLVLSLLRGYVQRRVHILGGRVHLGPVLQQQHGYVHIAQTGGDVEGSLLFPGAGVHLGTVSKQDSYYVGLK